MKLLTFPITLLLVLSGNLAWADLPTAQMLDIPTLKHAVNKGQTITAENVMQTPTPATAVFVSTVVTPQQVVGMQAVRPLAAGQPISKLHLRLAPTISRSSAVVLRYTRGGIELLGSGTALEDGQLGQSIKVLNPATRSTLVGVVQSDNIVQLN